MNKAGVRESIKMVLSTVDYALAKQYSDSFLDKLLLKSYSNVVTKVNAIMDETVIVPEPISALSSEDYHELVTELGEELITVIDSYIELGNIDNFYLIRKVVYNGNKVPAFKYENIQSLLSSADFIDPAYYLQGSRMYFINGSDREFLLYFSAKPVPILDDAQEFELLDEFEDAIVYDVIKRLAIGNKAFDYNMIRFEYDNAMDYAKDYYKKKYIHGTGSVIPQEY